MTGTAPEGPPPPDDLPARQISNQDRPTPAPPDTQHRPDLPRRP